MILVWVLKIWWLAVGCLKFWFAGCFDCFRLLGLHLYCLLGFWMFGYFVVDDWVICSFVDWWVV